jgi:hypothetical protein
MKNMWSATLRVPFYNRWSCNNHNNYATISDDMNGAVSWSIRKKTAAG